MNPKVFTTETLPARDQFEAWQEWFSPLLDITPCQPVHSEFRAENKVWNLGPIVVSRVSAPGVISIRKKANIARAPVDHWVLTYCWHGGSKFLTSKAAFEVPMGRPFLWSLGDESAVERPAMDRIQVLLSRDAFQDVTSLFDAARGSVLETPLGSLLADYLIALERWLPFVEATDMPRLAVALHSMVTACIAPSAERLMAAKTEVIQGRIEQVRQAVQKHLHSPRLGPDMLCRILHMSRSQLYRLFEHTGGIVRYIQSRRLHRAYTILSDPTNTRSIARVAAELCFVDASSFSRAFRQGFGCSPSDVRSAAIAGSPLVALPRLRQELEVSRFGDFL